MTESDKIYQEYENAKKIIPLSERLEIKTRLTISLKNGESYEDVMRDIEWIKQRHIDERLRRKIEKEKYEMERKAYEMERESSKIKVEFEVISPITETI